MEEKGDFVLGFVWIVCVVFVRCICFFFVSFGIYFNEFFYLVLISFYYIFNFRCGNGVVSCIVDLVVFLILL